MSKEVESNEEKKEYAFEISVLDEVFYTFIFPLMFLNESNEVIIELEKCIKQVVLFEEVLGEKVAVFYCEETDPKNTKINLSTVSVNLTTIEKNNLEWLNKTKEQAESELKSKVLEFYQKVTPQIVLKLNELEKRLAETNIKGSNVNSMLL